MCVAYLAGKFVLSYYLPLGTYCSPSRDVSVSDPFPEDHNGVDQEYSEDKKTAPRRVLSSNQY